MSQFFTMLSNSFPTQQFLSVARPEMMKQSSYVIYHQHIHHHHYHPASWSSTPITSYRSLMCKCDWKYWISSWRSLDSVTSSIHSNGMPIFKTWKSSSSRSPCWSSWSWPPWWAGWVGAPHRPPLDARLATKASSPLKLTWLLIGGGRRGRKRRGDKGKKKKGD